MGSKRIDITINGKNTASNAMKGAAKDMGKLSDASKTAGQKMSSNLKSALDTMQKDSKSAATGISKNLSFSGMRFTNLSNNFNATMRTMTSSAKSAAKDIAESFNSLEGVMAGVVGGAGLMDFFNKAQTKATTQVQLINRFGASQGAQFQTEYQRYTERSSTSDEQLNLLFQGVSKLKGITPQNVQGLMNAADAMSVMGDPVATRELQMGLKDYLSTGSTRRLMDDLDANQIKLLNEAYASGDPKKIQEAIETIAKQKGNMDEFGNSITSTTTGPLGGFNKALTALDAITRGATDSMRWLVDNVIGPVADEFLKLDEALGGNLSKGLGTLAVALAGIGTLGIAISGLSKIVDIASSGLGKLNPLSWFKNKDMNVAKVNIKAASVDVDSATGGGVTGKGATGGGLLASIGRAAGPLAVVTGLFVAAGGAIKIINDALGGTHESLMEILNLFSTGTGNVGNPGGLVGASLLGENFTAIEQLRMVFPPLNMILTSFDALKKIVTDLGDLFTWLGGAAQNTYNWLVSGAQWAYNGVSGAFNSILNTGRSVFNSIYGAAQRAYDYIRKGVSGTINIVSKGLSSAWKSVTNLYDKVREGVTGVINYVTGSGPRGPIGMARGPSGPYDGVKVRYQNYAGAQKNAWNSSGTCLTGNCVDMTLGAMSRWGGSMVAGTWNGGPHVWWQDPSGRQVDFARKALNGTFDPPARGPGGSGNTYVFNGPVYDWDSFKKDVSRANDQIVMGTI